MGMTMGNAHLINIVAEFCVYNHVIGVDKKDGEVIWLHSHAVSFLRSQQIDGRKFSEPIFQFSFANS